MGVSRTHCLQVDLHSQARARSAARQGQRTVLTRAGPTRHCAWPTFVKPLSVGQDQKRAVLQQDEIRVQAQLHRGRDRHHVLDIGSEEKGPRSALRGHRRNRRRCPRGVLDEDPASARISRTEANTLIYSTGAAVRVMHTIGRPYGADGSE